MNLWLGKKFPFSYSNLLLGYFLYFPLNTIDMNASEAGIKHLHLFFLKYQ